MLTHAPHAFVHNRLLGSEGRGLLMDGNYAQQGNVALTLSRPVQPGPVLSGPILSCPVLSTFVLSSLVLSYLVLSCPVLSSLVLSCSVWSCPDWCCLVPSCPVQFRPISVLSGPTLFYFSLFSWKAFTGGFVNARYLQRTFHKLPFIFTTVLRGRNYH